MAEQVCFWQIMRSLLRVFISGMSELKRALKQIVPRLSRLDRRLRRARRHNNILKFAHVRLCPSARGPVVTAKAFSVPIGGHWDTRRGAERRGANRVHSPLQGQGCAVNRNIALIYLGVCVCRCMFLLSIVPG